MFKFPRSHNIKLEFASSEMARKACKSGLLLFHISISPHQIRQKVYTPLLTCNKCQAVEAHSTRDCPKPQGYVRCSECGSQEHSFRECRATEKHCMHCHGKHSCRAMRCPVRKEALREKEDRARVARDNPAPTTFAGITRQATPSAEGSWPNLAGMMCVFNAHLNNVGEPGSFQQSLREPRSQRLA